MNDYVGHDKAWRQFATACDSGKIHHGWILTGPRGIGKSAFALRAAAKLVDPENVYESMIARGSHPDILFIKRLPKEPLKEDEVIDEATEFKRSITVDQIRGLQQSLTTRPGLSNRRAIIIDAADDLEHYSSRWRSRPLAPFSFSSAMPATGCCRPFGRAARSCGLRHWMTPTWPTYCNARHQRSVRMNSKH